MIAFHGKPEIKQKYLKRLRAHAKADEIIYGDGVFWENGKGCAVGCTIHGSDYLAYERELGIAEEIAHFEGLICECLPNDSAKTFPVRFLEAIPVGADLSMVIPNFFYWMLTVDVKPTEHPEFQPFIDAVVALYEEWTRTGVKPPDRAALASEASLAQLTCPTGDRAYLAYRAYWRFYCVGNGRAYLTRNFSSEKFLELLATAPVKGLEAFGVKSDG